MKEVYSYQELGSLIKQGTPVTCLLQVEAHVTAIQLCPDRDRITAVIQLSLGNFFLGEVECEFPTIALLLDAFGIHEQAELWEVAKAQAYIRGRR